MSTKFILPMMAILAFSTVASVDEANARKRNDCSCECMQQDEKRGNDERRAYHDDRRGNDERRGNAERRGN